MGFSVLAVTMGDPAGIGPEIIQKTLSAESGHKGCVPLIIGSPSAFRLLKERTGFSLDYTVVTEKDLPGIRHPEPCLLDVSRDARELLRSKGIHAREEIIPGKLSPWSAALAWCSVRKAVDLALSRQVEGMVTAPVNKSAIRLLFPDFTGHTEFLAGACGARTAMMFVSSRLKLTLATIHIPLKDVSRSLNREGIVEKIRLTHDFLVRRLDIRQPRIGVCALNPHGEETGSEENEIIAPAVEASRRQGMDARGPFSADLLFYEAYQGRYDALIAMYHDQGLAPFKMIAFHDGVNVTLGLPFLRTSPDHGTAFDIAFHGKADASSMGASFALLRRFAPAGHQS